MNNEGSKQGLYREKKIAQLGKRRYTALELRARSTYPRRQAIIDFMGWLGVV